MGERPWLAVPCLMHGVDRQADDMGEEGCVAVAVPVAERVPKLFRLFGTLRPALVPCANCLGRDAVVQPRRRAPKLTVFRSNSRQLSGPL